MSRPAHTHCDPARASPARRTLKYYLLTRLRLCAAHSGDESGERAGKPGRRRKALWEEGPLGGAYEEEPEVR